MRRLQIVASVVVVVGLLLLGASIITPSKATAPKVGSEASSVAPAGCSAGHTCAAVKIDFAGAPEPLHANVAARCHVPAGSAAWDCIKQAVGEQNIAASDGGPGLGIFVKGFYGSVPDFGKCGCYWQFFVNGVSSDTGVSSYIVMANDSIEFRIGK